MDPRFHSDAKGPSVQLSDADTTACRLQPRGSYNGGMVFSARPLNVCEIFTIKINRLISVWCGSIEIGIVLCDPMVACQFPSASSIELPSWVLSGERLYSDSLRMDYSLNSGRTLDDLREGDTLGVRLTTEGGMEIYINGESEGIVARNIPMSSTDGNSSDRLWAVVDMYGACQQISVCNDLELPTERQDINLESTRESFGEMLRGYIESDIELNSDVSDCNESLDFTSIQSTTFCDSDTDIVEENVEDSDGSNDYELRLRLAFGNQSGEQSDGETVVNENISDLSYDQQHLRSTINAQSLRSTINSPESDIMLRLTEYRWNRTNNAENEVAREMRQLFSEHRMMSGNMDESESILRHLERNRSLRESNEISRRRRSASVAYGRVNMPSTNQQSNGLNLENYLESGDTDDGIATQTMEINIPFHSMRGTQVSIGSNFRTARLHNQLRRIRSRVRSAPVLFSAFSTNSKWSVLASKNATAVHSSIPTSPNDALVNWKESFWFGITIIDPSLVTSEWINEQFERKTMALKEILYVTVKATAGQPLELFQEGQLVSEGMYDRRSLNQRRGSIGAISFPSNDESSSSNVHKFEYKIGSNNGVKTIQITSGPNMMSNHSTGRIRFDSSLPIYGFVMLSEAVNVCEIPVSEDDGGSYDLSNLLTDVQRLSHLTTASGTNWTESSRAPRLRPRRWIRARGNSPENSSMPCRMRSLTTTDNISSQHIYTREGLYEITSRNSTSYVVFEPSTNLIMRGSKFILKIYANSSSEIELGFLPSHDYSKDENKGQRLDEFCLRPIEISAIKKHIFALKIKNGKVIHPEVTPPDHEPINKDSILSVSINEDDIVVLQSWKWTTGQLKGEWLDVTKTKNSIETRRMWIGYVRVSGEHGVKVYHEQQGIPRGHDEEPHQSITPLVMQSINNMNSKTIDFVAMTNSVGSNRFQSNRPVLDEELIEYKVETRNNHFMYGMELGVFSRKDKVDLFVIRNGRIWSNEKFKFVGGEIEALDNLHSNDRFGIVWRQTEKSKLGSVFLVLRGSTEIEVVYSVPQPYIYLHLNGNVEQAKFIPENERSRLWSPNITYLTGRISFYPVRHCYQSIHALRWDGRLKTKNVKIEKLPDKQMTFTVKQSSLDFAQAFTELKSFHDGFHFEVMVMFNMSNLNGLCLYIAHDYQNEHSATENSSDSEQMAVKKIKNAHYFMNDKIFYSDSTGASKVVGTLPFNLKSLKSGHRFGFRVCNSHFITILRNGKKFNPVPLTFPSRFNIGIQFNCTASDDITVSTVPRWQIEDDDLGSIHCKIPRSFSSATLSNSKLIPPTTPTKQNLTVGTKVPFLYSTKSKNNTDVNIKKRPLWSGHGKNISLINNNSFELKKNTYLIGENYLITNQIFIASYDKIEIRLEKSREKPKGFMYGVKSELENSDNFVFLRQMDSDCSCVIDFATGQIHGRCLIPNDDLDLVMACYRKSRLNYDIIKLLKKDENIYVNFNFVTKPASNNGYYLDECGNYWFLFCRILTPGRIILELNRGHFGGTIIAGHKEDNIRSHNTFSEKKLQLMQNHQLCLNAHAALSMVNITHIKINDSILKCYCFSCFQKHNENKNYLKGFVKLYLTNIPKEENVFQYQILSRDHVSSIAKRNNIQKNDFRDCTKNYYHSIQDLIFTIKTKNNEHSCVSSEKIIGEFLITENTSKAKTDTVKAGSTRKLRNIYIWASS